MSCGSEWPRPCAGKVSVKPRKSTAILGAAWVATFVLYLFVKPDQPAATGVTQVVNTVPALVNAEQFGP